MSTTVHKKYAVSSRSGISVNGTPLAEYLKDTKQNEVCDELTEIMHVQQHVPLYKKPRTKFMQESACENSRVRVASKSEIMEINKELTKKVTQAQTTATQNDKRGIVGVLISFMLSGKPFTRQDARDYVHASGVKVTKSSLDTAIAKMLSIKCITRQFFSTQETGRKQDTIKHIIYAESRIRRHIAADEYTDAIVMFDALIDTTSVPEDMLKTTFIYEALQPHRDKVSCDVLADHSTDIKTPLHTCANKSKKINTPAAIPSTVDEWQQLGNFVTKMKAQGVSVTITITT